MGVIVPRKPPNEPVGRKTNKNNTSIDKILERLVPLGSREDPSSQLLDSSKRLQTYGIGPRRGPPAATYYKSLAVVYPFRSLGPDSMVKAGND